MARDVLVALLGAFSEVLLAGCQEPVYFPAAPLREQPNPQQAHRAYDVNNDGKPDFFTYADAAGRIDRLGYDDDGDGQPEKVVLLDAPSLADCRHLVLIVDGFGHDVVKQHYDAGHLRMFHPPSRVVAPYPTMTDLAMEDLFGYMPCEGFEAMYFDRKANKLVGGSMAYLAGKNQPYNRLLHYRADLIWDALGYLAPWKVFGKEINDAKRLFDRGRTQEVRAYFVSSAGVSTQQGADGQRKCLELVERLVNQVLWETRGLTKVTLMSDHGHSYTPSTRIELDKHLQAKGWKLTNSLRGDRDVVYIRFGLETAASLATNRPAELARDLVTCEGVEVASYADGDAVVVLGHRGGRAVIRRSGKRYGYQTQAGDPLKLKDILAKLQADEKGFYDADALLAATAAHEYPAPLQRIWRAHLALVANPPDVIISLADRFYSGAKSFAGSVQVASTHGGLNHSNSVAFIMSTIGPLPPVMRSSDVPGAMGELLGAPWPLAK